MAKHTVKQGECISSIADKYGFFWDTLWNLPENAELKRKRKDPNVLFLRDQVFVPDRRVKTESGATEQRHRFRKKGIPAKLRLRVLWDDDTPRADEPYVLEIDGILFSGTTDHNGDFEHSIPPGAKKGKLVVGEERDEYLLNLGHIDPIDEITGIQTRLKNLGFDCGVIDGVLGSKTEAALREFQEKYNLTESGKADEGTRNKLLEIHGS